MVSLNKIHDFLKLKEKQLYIYVCKEEGRNGDNDYLFILNGHVKELDIIVQIDSWDFDKLKKSVERTYKILVEYYLNKNIFLPEKIEFIINQVELEDWLKI